MSTETRTHDSAASVTPASEWRQLTASVGTQAIQQTLYEGNDEFILVTADQTGTPRPLVEVGSDIAVEPLIDAECLTDLIADRWRDSLSSDDCHALVEWYHDLVTETVELDLFDDTYQTPNAGRICYAGLIDEDCLVDEIMDIIGTEQSELATEIARTIPEWRERKRSVPTSAAACDYAAAITLVDARMTEY